MNVRIVGETATTVTVEWDPPAGQQLVRTTRPDGAQYVTWNPTLNRRTFSKKQVGSYVVDVLGLVDSGYAEWPVVVEPPPPVGQFGKKLPARLPPSPGPVVNMTGARIQDVISKLASCPYGNILDGGGTTLSYPGGSGSSDVPDQFTAWAKSRDGNGTTTTLRNFRFDRAMPHVRGKWFRIEHSQSVNANPWGARIETGRYVDIDAFDVTNSVRSAFMCTYGALDWQIWNSIVRDPGKVDGKGAYAVYAESFNNACVVASNLLIRPERWAVHAYSGQDRALGFPMDGLLVTGNTMIHGGGPGDHHDKGGAIITSWSTNVRLVGNIVVGSPSGIVECTEALSAGNRLAGCVEWGSTGSSSGLASMAPVAHSKADPKLDGQYRPQPGSSAIGLVPPTWHDWLPPQDIDGKPRVTADAGCYAA